MYGVVHSYWSLFAVHQLYTVTGHCLQSLSCTQLLVTVCSPSVVHSYWSLFAVPQLYTVTGHCLQSLSCTQLLVTVCSPSVPPGTSRILLSPKFLYHVRPNPLIGPGLRKISSFNILPSCIFMIECCFVYTSKSGTCG